MRTIHTDNSWPRPYGIAGYSNTHGSPTDLSESTSTEDEPNRTLGATTRTACDNDPERLRVWASAVELMWNGDLSRFLEAVARAVGGGEA